MANIIGARDALEPARDVLLAGGIVAIPTETVYGLAGDATNGDAVLRIFEAKGRPRFNPLIAHVSSIEMAEALARFDPLSRRLAEHFWPGPLTIVLPMVAGSPVHPLATAGLDTVALRAPRGFGRELIEALRRPLAAPSANSSGRISGTSAAAVAADLGARIPLIVDGGQTPVGLESTIIKVEPERIVLLRPGGLPVEEIEALSDRPVMRRHGGEIVAPGMLASHYAPDARVRLDVDAVRPDEALLAFGPYRVEGADRARAMLNLSETGDLREASRNLFAFLQQLDLAGAATIAVEPIPGHGLGEAINDRLSRAAAPRGAPHA